MDTNTVKNIIEMLQITKSEGRIIMIVGILIVLMLMVRLVIKYAKPFMIVGILIFGGLFFRLYSPNTFEAVWDASTGIVELAVDFGHEAILLTEAHMGSM
jgi:hypothetical protein